MIEVGRSYGATKDCSCISYRQVAPTELSNEFECRVASRAN